VDAVADLVSDKIDLMEFGLYGTSSGTFVAFGGQCVYERSRHPLKVQICSIEVAERRDIFHSRHVFYVLMVSLYFPNVFKLK